METEDREDILASRAMWARDYERAFKFYSSFLQAKGRLDTLMSYRIYFDLTVVSTILGKFDFESIYHKNFNDLLADIAETRDRMKERTRLSIEKVRSRIAEQTDPKKMQRLLTKYFPREEEMLGYFISPRYSRGFLRTVLRNAKTSRPPQVFEAGIFRYTLDSELYRVIGKAYSIEDLELERLPESGFVEALIKNPGVYYVENKDLGIIAAIQREGLVLVQYFLRASKDNEGSDQIAEFLRTISKILSV